MAVGPSIPLNVGAPPPPGGSKRDAQAGVPGLVVLIEVQAEAEKLETLV